MTDRIHSRQIVLTDDIRDDDIEPFINAVRQFKWVADVVPMVKSGGDTMAEIRARVECDMKLVDMLDVAREDLRNSTRRV